MSRLLLTSDLARGLFRLSRELDELRRSPADLRAQHALGGLVRLVGGESAVASVGAAPGRRPASGPPRIATWGYAAPCGGARLQSVYEGVAALDGAPGGARPREGRAISYPPRAAGDLARLAASRLETAHVLESPVDPARANPVASLAVGRDEVLGAFTCEEATALHLFHVECGWALASELPRVEAGAAPAAPLTPRERATLACLLAGASEKEAAAQLGLSVHTVHQYVKCLYKAFAVRSRAELMARCLGGDGAVRAA